MNTAKFLLVCLGASLGLASCKKGENEERDTTPPTISNVLINGQPSIVSAEVRDTIHVSALLSDNVELGKLEITVESSGGYANWHETVFIDLNGSSQTIEHDFAIWPNAQPASYVVSFQFTDHNGNKADYDLNGFQVINKWQPKIHDLKIDFDDGSYDHQKGDTLKFSGTITDDQDLTMVTIDLNIPPGYSGDLNFFDAHFDLINPSDTLWDFEKDGHLEVYFPPYSKNGGYRLTLTVVDNDGNLVRVTDEVGP